MYKPKAGGVAKAHPKQFRLSLSKQFCELFLLDKESIYRAIILIYHDSVPYYFDLIIAGYSMLHDKYDQHYFGLLPTSHCWHPIYDCSYPTWLVVL